MLPLLLMAGGTAAQLAGSGLNMAASRQRELALDAAQDYIDGVAWARRGDIIQRSDNLRRAMESFAERWSDKRSDFWSTMASPARMAEAQENADRARLAAQAGIDRAMAGIAPPPSRPYQSVVPQVAPETPLPNAVEATDPYRQSLVTERTRRQPALDALLDELVAGGYLRGLSGFDQGTRGNLDLALGALDRGATNFRLAHGVGDAERALLYGDTMRLAEAEKEKAAAAGDTLALIANILGSVGGAMGGLGGMLQKPAAGTTSAPGSVFTGAAPDKVPFKPFA
jgi:hypothetical protein